MNEVYLSIYLNPLINFVLTWGCFGVLSWAGISCETGASSEDDRELRWMPGNAFFRSARVLYSNTKLEIKNLEQFKNI